MHCTLNLSSTVLILSNFERCIGNDEGDNNFKSYDEVLNQNCEEDNVSSSPVVGVYLTHVLDQDRLFSRLKFVEILDDARILCWEASENQN